MSCDGCGERWLVESCDIKTGQVRTILRPLSMDFGTTLNKVGQGSMTLATRDVLVRDIWPHLVTVYISRLTDDEPVVEFAGIIESFAAEDSGETTLGLKEITDYLQHRNLRVRREFPSVGQNEISRQLAEYARTNNGIPLVGAAPDPGKPRDRTWESWDRKNIGEALEEMTNVIEGNDWELSHVKSQFGQYTTTMTFRDVVGSVKDVIIQSDRDAAQYGLDVDAGNHATMVDAIGSGEDDDMLIATAQDTTGPYPQYDDAPSWKDVTIPETLQSHADGYLEDYQEPMATPNVTIAGHDFPHSDVDLGDTITIKVNYGAVTFDGPARVLGSAWRVADGDPDTRTFTLLPITRASQSVLFQEPTDDGCEEC